MELAGGTDYRLRQLTQAGIYLPAGDTGHAGATGGAVWRLAGHGARAMAQIQIEGRADHRGRGAVPRCVWFSFAALCGGARSQDDYIEIAREYQSVMSPAFRCSMRCTTMRRGASWRWSMSSTTVT